MATTIEYALLAGVSYRDTRADLNRFPNSKWLERCLDCATG